MLNHYLSIVKAQDSSVDSILRNQCLDLDSPQYGICEHHALGYISAEQGIGIAATLVSAYYTPESAYYRNDLLLERTLPALRHTLSLQHDDGTIDLPQTNFHCASTVAFTFFHLGPAYQLLKRFTQHTDLEEQVDQLLHIYCDNSANGMINCGFHTPNHRWVLCSALSYCYTLLGREDCLEHIHRFLNEGMDCDEEGEYTERSAGTYNIICDAALTNMAEELNMPELYDHVARNLRMVMKYIEPDNTVNTLNSTRQDVGTSPSYLCYYSNFLNMALITGDEEFAYFADKMLLERDALILTGQPFNTPYVMPSRFLLRPELMEHMAQIKTRKPVLEYDKYFIESGIVRWRKSDLAVTLIKNRPIFAKLQWGKHTVHLRLAGCFFARGQFAAQELIPIEGGYRLTFHDRWGYKRPLSEKPATWKWREMDHSKREQVAMQDYDLCVDVLFVNDRRIELTVSASGCDRVPTKFEILLQEKGRYIRSEMEIRMRGGDYLYQKGGKAEYRFDDNRAVYIEGGFFEHHYAEHMRGTLPVNDSAAFVAMTAYSPFKETVAFEFE